jgi:uncharacterized protein
MLLTVAELRHRVRDEIGGLVHELQEQTGRRGVEEAAAWRASLPAVSDAFSARLFQPLHIYFGGRGNLSLEYRLPASSSWCDMVLLGSHAGRATAAIVELKHWETRGDRPGPTDALVERMGGLDLHPSDQVRGYVEYCRYFHSAVQANEALVHGCVVFTKDRPTAAYTSSPHHELTLDYPCFAANDDDSRGQLVYYFASRLSEPDVEFAQQFEAGWYEQDRSFVRNIGETLARSAARPLVLLDNQRYGFALAKAEIEAAVFEPGDRGRKRVIIVEGPPGSGKSVIAAKVWAALAADPRLDRGRFVLTSTSKAQETNWKHLIQSVVGHHGASGVVMPANKYAPGTIQELSWFKSHRPGTLRSSVEWRENLRVRSEQKGEPWMPDDHFEVSIVDEAHALINPEIPRAVTIAGWPNAYGPQAYHIIRSSKVAVFLLDPEQRFRERESTSQADIECWAQELGAGQVKHVSLKGAQFRCAGSSEYVGWVEALLADKSLDECRERARQWRKDAASEAQRVAESNRASYSIAAAAAARRPPGSLEFTICDSPAELEELLRSRLTGNITARLVASFGRPWKTEKQAHPHDLASHEQDFCFSWTEGGRERLWARPWNVVPGDDYSHFIQAAMGTPIADDPLAEVGCTYAVRGFDFDYIGLLWLRDLCWVDGRWAVDFKHVCETGLSRTLKSATRQKNPDLTARAEALERVKQAYRILLTRAIKGVFVWCEDPATDNYLRSASRP